MQTNTENLKREILEIFFAQSKIIWSTTIILFVLALLIAFLWPPTYSATGSVLVRRKNADISPQAIEEVRSQIRAFPVTNEDLLSEMEIMLSPDLIEKTVVQLKENNQLRKDAPGFLDKIFDSIGRKKISSSSIKDPEIASEVLRIKSKISTKIIPASNVIKVTYYSKDPTDAVTVLNTLLSQYTLFRARVLNPAQVSFYEKQAQKFSNDLDQIDNSIISMVRSTGVTDPAREIESNLLLKNQYSQTLGQLEQEAIGKELYIKRLDEALASEEVQFFAFIDLPSFVELRKQLETLYVERGNYLRNYLETSNKIKGTDIQIADTFKALKNEISGYRDTKQNELDIINNTIEKLRDKLASIDETNAIMKKQLIEMKRLEQDAALISTSYETFAMRREESSISDSSGDATSPISMLHSAFPSNGPVFPQKRVVVPFGLIVGFITGCCLGFIMEFLDHTFKRASDVKANTDLPLIFSINKWN